ncbi:transporter [Pendulispora rubella]
MSFRVATIVFLTGLSQSAEAAENGENSVILGVDTMVHARTPPPGWYFSSFTQLYLAGHSERHGVDVPGFRLVLFVQGGRLQHVWKPQLFGHSISTDMLIPVSWADIRVAGRSDNQVGMGDIQFVPLRLSNRFEVGSGSFAYAAFSKVVTPTGLYRTEPNAIASPGTNHWAFAPSVALTYFSATLNVGTTIGYVFNTKNPATHYVNGQEFQIDYVAEHKWFDAFWGGACGYFYEQMTDDVNPDPAVPGDVGNQGRVLGLGAQLRREFSFGNINVKWIHEVLAENRAEGDRFFVQLFLPL